MQQTDIMAILSKRSITPDDWFCFCKVMFESNKTEEDAARLFADNFKGHPNRGYDNTLHQISYYYDFRRRNNTNTIMSMGDAQGRYESTTRRYTYLDLLRIFNSNFKPLKLKFEVPMGVYSAALEYHKHGFHVIPVDYEKKPLLQWNRGEVDYSEVPLDPTDIERSYWRYGLAVLGSSKHTFLDIDMKSAKHPDGIEKKEIDRIIAIFRRWHIERSKNGGIHIWGAGDISAITVKAALSACDGGVMIKGKRSYIVAAPTPGYEVI